MGVLDVFDGDCCDTRDGGPLVEVVDRDVGREGVFVVEVEDVETAVCFEI